MSGIEIGALCVVGAFLLFAAVRLFRGPVKLALRVLVNSALGFGAVWLLNLTAALTGIRLGLNVFNALFIGVLGVPIDRTYPAANAALRQKIERKGCVISEYPPCGEGVGPNGFLQRNRLIAALSSALVVVEAQEKSGTMSTVNHAERYGKPVFVVPGSIYSPNSAGTNALLREGRAKAVCKPGDLFGVLGLRGAAAPAAVRSAPDPMSETERRVLACIGPKAKGVEELGAASGLPTGLLLGTLMKLELAGRVTCLPGKRYILR